MNHEDITDPQWRVRQHILEALRALAQLPSEHTRPGSRERAIVKTKLEEARMWFDNAVPIR